MDELEERPIHEPGQEAEAEEAPKCVPHAAKKPGARVGRMRA